MRASANVFACVVVAVLLAACIEVGPDFTQPSSDVRQRWMEADDARVDETRAIDERWWTVFNDDALNRLVDIAYRQNISLLSAATRVLQARAQLAVAVGQFYPQTQQAF